MRGRFSLDGSVDPSSREGRFYFPSDESQSSDRLATEFATSFYVLLDGGGKKKKGTNGRLYKNI